MNGLEHFLEADLRVGTIVKAEAFPEAKKPAIKLYLDFGPELGVLQSSAQITAHYEPEDLTGRQVVALVNTPTRKIAGFNSEVLVLGAVNDELRDVVLLTPDRKVDPGSRIA
ncbi:MAG TPA: tRNA-binding protein [Saprospiraceae bacterium]|nr:tRNA-binding protein [Saprospiraceae bacterium]